MGPGDKPRDDKVGGSALSLSVVSQFLAAVAGNRDPAHVAASFAQHLAALTTQKLPASAQGQWREVARLLKAPAEKPIPERAVAAIKSWPGARIGELIAQIEKLHEILDKLENERLEDEIRDSIRRHYL